MNDPHSPTPNADPAPAPNPTTSNAATTPPDHGRNRGSRKAAPGGRWRRGAAFLALTATLVFTMTGCVRVDLGLEIHGTGDVSGELIAAFDNEMVEVAGIEGQIEDMIQSYADIPYGVSVERYSRDGYTGARVEFDHVPAAGFKDSPAGMTVTREGDEFVVRIDVSEELIDAEGEEMIAMYGDPEATYEIKFPGAVLESNGEESGRTVTWNYNDIEREGGILEARGSAIYQTPWLAIWIVLGGILVVGLVAFVARARRRTATPAALMPFGNPGTPGYAGAAGATYRGPAGGWGPAPRPGRGPAGTTGATGGMTQGLPTYPTPHAAASAPAPQPAPPAPQQVAAPQAPTHGPPQYLSPPVPPIVQPGWYRTPDGQSLAYHDGWAWTGHVQPLPHP